MFASEQKRRLKGFGGFKTRRAIAVIPNLEEYKRRYEQKVAKYGAEVPETTLNTMKGMYLDCTFTRYIPHSA